MSRRARSAAQFAEFLDLPRWQFDRAVKAGTIPPQDRARGWSADAADAALARIGEILASAGTVPDCGSSRAAKILTGCLGITVTGNGVSELGRRGLISIADYYDDGGKSWPIYDGRDLEAFTDEAAAVDACQTGYLRTAANAAVYLLIRRTDLDHLVRAGLLKPADWAQGPYDRKHDYSVPLYRTGDLDNLARRADIDWDAVRGTRAGRRSPLASLPSARERGR